MNKSSLAVDRGAPAAQARIARDPASRERGEEQALAEDPIDPALELTFPASDLPTWSCAPT
jgi:hypothetical protein